MAVQQEFHATVDLRQAQSEQDLHAAFKAALQLPDFYGMNWSAWIDCLSDWSTANGPGMTGVVLSAEESLCIRVLGAEKFKRAAPRAYDLLLECINDVNERMVHAGDARRLVITFE